MRTTSAVMTSPERISLLFSDSSNIAAKESGAKSVMAWVLGMVFLMAGGATWKRALPALYNPGRVQVRVEHPPPRTGRGVSVRRFRRRRRGRSRKQAMGFAAFRRRLRATTSEAALVPGFEHRLDAFVDGHAGVVEQDRILGRL